MASYMFNTILLSAGLAVGMCPYMTHKSPLEVDTNNKLGVQCNMNTWPYLDILHQYSARTNTVHTTTYRLFTTVRPLYVDLALDKNYSLFILIMEFTPDHE